MISDFIEKMMRLARYKLLDDGSYFGDIAKLKGVWSSAKNLEDCRAELQEVLEDWLILKISSGESVPGLSMKSVGRKQHA